MLDTTNANDELFRLRCKYGKTQKEVADGSKVSEVTINRIEKRKLKSEKLRAKTFNKLNKYFEGLGE